jgi:hypothetical protein
MRIIIPVVACLLISVNTIAQYMSVKSFQLLGNDLSALVDYPKIDQNGHKAALIKVVTTQTGFEFDGGQLGIVAVEQKTAEVWVYVPYKAKNLTIKHPRLGLIRNYAYPIPIEAGRTYELELVSGTIETTVRPAEIETQWLAINTSPEGANVFIEEVLAGTTPFTRKLPEGEYIYRIELSRYHPQAGKVTLKGNKETLSFTMQPRFGNISVTSSPERNMMIYLNDENTGKKTPATLTDILSGDHTIKLMDEWYQPQAKRITVLDNQTVMADFSMEPAFATISITTIPAAAITIDGTRKATGSHSERIRPGIYTLKAELDKHHTEQRQLVVEAGKNQSIELNLRPQTGHLDITSTPFDATITLNSKNYGTTPNTIKDLLVGNYTLVLEKPNHQTITKTITIDQGKTTEVNENLISTQPKIPESTTTTSVTESEKSARDNNLFVFSTPKNNFFETNISPPKKPASPIEIVLPCNDNEFRSNASFIRSTGMYESRSIDIAQRQAYANAISIMATIVSNIKNAALEKYSQEVDYKNEFNEKFELLTRDVVNCDNIHYAETVCKRIIYNQEKQTFTCYIAIQIAKENVLK